jgi:hypothetical protein
LQLLFTWLDAAVIGAAMCGSGRHFADLTSDNIVKAAKFWWAAELSYTICTAMIKLSICFLLLRIVVSKVHKYIVYIVMALNAYSLFYFFLLMLQCRPISYFWNPKEPGHCINRHFVEKASYIFTAVCLATDLTLAILPLFFVWNLNMNQRTKYAVAGILALAAM